MIKNFFKKLLTSIITPLLVAFLIFIAFSEYSEYVIAVSIFIIGWLRGYYLKEENQDGSK